MAIASCKDVVVGKARKHDLKHTDVGWAPLAR